MKASAIFAGGCFWCMEPPFDELDGVLDTTVGYTGGSTANPTYDDVCEGNTGHLEAVRVTYDPSKISYRRLLDVFWHNVDPTDGGGQFCDRGESYKTAIFTADDEQRALAEASKAELDGSGLLPDKVATKILPAAHFWPAEDYHQYYYRNNPLRYKFYRYSCGRDRRLQSLWRHP